MTVEMQMLTFASILGLIQLLISAHFATLQRGIKWNLSARDSNAAPLSGVAGRLDRAFRNFLETFPVFIAAVFLVYATERSSVLTVVGAQLYLYARVVYVFIYASGIPKLRTLVWSVSLIGLVVMFSALF